MSSHCHIQECLSLFAIRHHDTMLARSTSFCKTFAVWVPSEFYRGVYAAHGVHRDRLQVVPEPVSDLLLTMSRSACREHALPTAFEPLFSQGRRPFVFLSVFKWEVS